MTSSSTSLHIPAYILIATYQIQLFSKPKSNPELHRTMAGKNLENTRQNLIMFILRWKVNYSINVLYCFSIHFSVCRLEISKVMFGEQRSVEAFSRRVGAFWELFKENMISWSSFTGLNMIFSLWPHNKSLSFGKYPAFH